MNSARAWLFFRSLRWLLWLGFIAYSGEFVAHQPNHMNEFGNLLPTTEALMFGLPLAAVVAGLFELMMRDRAGIPQPAFGRDWAGSPNSEKIPPNQKIKVRRG
jgi:hypothetical protein